MDNPGGRIETCWSPAVRALENNLTRLVDRSARLCEFGEDPLSWVTYFELIVVQLRAIACETQGATSKKNFTVQGILTRLGEGELKKHFDQFMNTSIGRDRFGRQYSYRDAVKTLADKFICHYDNYDETENSNAIPIEVYMDLIAILKAGALECLVGKVVDTIRQAMNHNLETFKKELICRLFGSQEEYERILNINWPRAD
ncbi:MAG: hypothetical protein IJH50_09065 [Kiritimatiellae bacterium]|nr:hypothetical protein [Kiritimatiellia bacterium]